MSPGRGKRMKTRIWSLGAAALLATSGLAEEPATVALPGGTFLMGGREGGAPSPREVTVGPFRIGRTEITVRELTDWLNAAGAPEAFASPQVAREDGRFVPARGVEKVPASGVRYDEALAYCGWLSGARGRRVRLPTESEWEYAARGGVDNARYPWGWGPPDDRACFRAAAPRSVGSYPPNGFGLYDMAGNVYEWCLAGDGGDKAVARGGSWSERDPMFLRVYKSVEFPRSYRNADVGFRIVIEEENKAEPGAVEAATGKP